MSTGKRYTQETISTADLFAALNQRGKPSAGRKPRASRPSTSGAPKPFKLTNPKPKQPSEASIHIAVVQALRQLAAPRVVWWHTPNGELRDKRTAAKLKAMGTRAGIPDLVLVIGGKLHTLELKTATGRLSPAQISMRAELEAASCTWASAHSTTEALNVLTSWGALRSFKVMG
jgi:hypothetical protein